MNVPETFMIDAEISPDGTLIYSLPSGFPVGRVKLIIAPMDDLRNEKPALSREEARERLRRAGKLVTILSTPPLPAALSEIEPTQPLWDGSVAPLTTLDIINQDRGPKE